MKFLVSRRLISLTKSNLSEAVEYKPLSIRELLKKIKNMSSLMLDLAYFAYLNENKEIAGLVMELEKKVDHLVYLLYINTSLLARDKEDAKLAAAIIKIGSALNEFANAAADIANLIRIGIPPHKYIKKAFEKTEEIVDDVQVEPGSDVIGLKLSDLEKRKIYIDVIALKRDKTWIVYPETNIRLKAGDILIVRGSKNVVDKFKRLCSIA